MAWWRRRGAKGDHGGQKRACSARGGLPKSGRRKNAHPRLAAGRARKRIAGKTRSPAWSKRRLPRSPTRFARRLPESSPSAICSRPPISMSASAAGSIPSRPAPSIWRALRPCSSMPPSDGHRRHRLARRICSTCGRSPATPAIRLPGGRRPRDCSRRSRFRTKLPALVVGDPVRLRAALENLIDNAVKFTEAGGVALAVTPMRGTKAKVGVAFAISDSGIGLTLAEIKRLFRPFSQANVSIASRFGGAGLGLSSVKQLARAMGGDIKVAQRRGGGATFTLTVSLNRARTRQRVGFGRERGAVAGAGAAAARAQRRGQSVRPRRAQHDLERTRPSGGVHRARRGRGGAHRAGRASTRC